MPSTTDGWKNTLLMRSNFPNEFLKNDGDTGLDEISDGRERATS